MTTVYMGGTCDSTWRDEFGAMLDSNKVVAFNPIVDDLSETAQAKKDWHKKNDDFFLYVLTPERKGLYDIFEVADASNKHPDKTIFCVLPEREGKTFSIGLQLNFQKIKKDLIRNGTRVCESLEEVATFLNNYELEKPKAFIKK